MDWHKWLDTALETYIAYILTREYYWGRSDTDIKREVARRKAARAKQKAEAAQIPAVPAPVETLKETK